MTRVGRFKEKVALITGGASGIGRETAHQLANEGATVIVADLQVAEAREVGRAIGGEAVAMNVCDRSSVVTALAGVERDFGKIDVLVNAAGVTSKGSVPDLSESQWLSDVDAILNSVYRVSAAAWPLLTKSTGGVIINIGSIVGQRPIPDAAAYCAAKAGVIALTQCLALDGAEAGIRANCVCPGFTATPMLDRYLDVQPDRAEAVRRLERIHPAGRIGEPSDIASAILYLASEEAEWVTGTVLAIDGGVTAGLWA